MNDTLTSILAVWGAVVATGTAAWNVYVYRRERDRGLVFDAVAQMHVDRHKQRTFELLACIFTNTGHRPCSVIAITAKGGRKPVAYHSHNRGRVLQQGETLEILLDPECLDGATALIAHDSLGRTVKLPRKWLRQLHQLRADPNSEP